MNNEEKILEMLEKLNGTVEKQGEMLKTQGVIVEQLHKTQLEQGMKLLEQSSALKSLTKEMEDLRQRSQRTALLMEADFAPKLQLLYEGHGAIMDILKTLSTKDRVEELEADIIVLKTAVKMLTQEVAELKKAQ